MKRLECQCIVVTLWTLIVLSGCSYNNVFEIDRATDGRSEEIIGIQDLYDDGAKNVNILFIHGMGYHPLEKEIAEKGVTRLYQDRLVKKLGFNENQEIEIISPIYPLKRNEVVAGYLSWRKFKDENGRTVNLFVLSWDRATEVIQKTILELDDEFYEKKEGTKDREHERAMLNRQLKRFINRSFADPAIYLGAFGKEIRYVVAEGIWIMDSILMENQNYVENPIDNQIVHISDSLGSSVIFDTVKETMASFDAKNELFNRREAIERFAGYSRSIYMNANQLPLIELGRIEGPAPNETEEQWLEKYPCHDSPNTSSGTQGILEFGKVKKKFMNQNKSALNWNSVDLQLVAFTDPNDALSYYLTKRFKEHCSGGDIRIVNVLLTNVRWNWLFILAHPGKAHAVGFKTNNIAIDLLVHGVESNGN